MTGQTGRKAGQPIAVFAILLIIWIAARSLLWQSPFPPLSQVVRDFIPSADTGRSITRSVAAMPLVDASDVPTERAAIRLFSQRPFYPDAINRSASQLATVPDHLRMGAGHQLLWMSAMSYAPIPDMAANRLDAFRGGRGVGMGHASDRSFFPPVVAGQGAAKTPWSFDTWLFLRDGSPGAASTGPFPASYGASQAGAVLRYRLDNQSARKPTAYVRVTKALSGQEQGDVAAGLSARPIAKLPVLALGEARISRNGPKTELRPAALLVTELPSVKLPMEFQGHAYAQAGYVGGDFATGFVDGQARFDRAIAKFDLASVRAGAGVWGGAQKGAARLDIGPSASVTVDVAGAPIRVAMDYRHRVVGDAVPQSGVALTISTGF